MMPRFQSAQTARAALARQQSVVSRETIATPQQLDEVVWVVKFDRITWNGHNKDAQQDFIPGLFRVCPGPFPKHLKDGEFSDERKRRNLVSAEILSSAMGFDLEITHRLYPTDLGTGAVLLENARRQRAEIASVAESLHRCFADTFWKKLDGQAREVTFTADQVVDWIGERTELMLQDYQGEWPGFARLAPTPTHKMAVAA